MNARVTTLVLTGTLALGGLAAGAVVIPAMAATATESATESTAESTSEANESSESSTTATEDPTASAEESAAARLADRVTLIREALNDLVSAGTIDESQADAVAESLAEQLPGRGPGPGGPGGHGWHGGGPGGPIGIQLEMAAATLGITVDELHAALIEGQSLADVAAEQGVDIEALVSALVEAAQARIAERVAAGDLTQAEADERTAHLTDRITELVEREGPAFGHDRGDRPGLDGATNPSTEPSAAVTS